MGFLSESETRKLTKAAALVELRALVRCFC